MPDASMITDESAIESTPRNPGGSDRYEKAHHEARHPFDFVAGIHLLHYEQADAAANGADAEFVHQGPERTQVAAAHDQYHQHCRYDKDDFREIQRPHFPSDRTSVPPIPSPPGG